MKKLFVALGLAVALTVVPSGCGNTWWANFQNDPVAQVQAFEQSAHIALSLADGAWNTVKGFLPPTTLAEAQPKYDLAVVAVNKALLVLNDAVQVDVEAKNPNPDYSKLIQAVSDAVAQVAAVVNEFKTPPATVAPGAMPMKVQGLDTLEQAVVSMKHVGHAK